MQLRIYIVILLTCVKFPALETGTGVKDVHDRHPQNIFPKPRELSRIFGSLSEIRKLKFRQ